MRVALSFEEMATCRQLSRILLWRIIPKKSNAKMFTNYGAVLGRIYHALRMSELTLGRY